VVDGKQQLLTTKNMNHTKKEETAKKAVIPAKAGIQNKTACYSY
jgi:hypothetical protein